MSKTIKISYIPKQDTITGYYNCRAIAPDGSVWDSVNNHWRKVSDAPDSPRSSVQSSDGPVKKYHNPEAPMFGALGFFLGMALFAKPVGMTFSSSPDIGISVLFIICCICAAVFSRIGR